jgi:hypothetical protein
MTATVTRLLVAGSGPRVGINVPGATQEGEGVAGSVASTVGVAPGSPGVGDAVRLDNPGTRVLVAIVGDSTVGGRGVPAVPVTRGDAVMVGVPVGKDV